MAQLIDRPSTNGHAPQTTIAPPLPPHRRPPRLRRPAGWVLVGASAAIVALLVAMTVWHLRAAASPTYVTVPVTQRSLIQTASASGTVNPQDTITVGTQVSGTISQIFVDYNSPVKAGQILAKLDPTQFEAALAQAQAALAQAQAQASAAGSAAQGQLANVAASQAQAAAQLATEQADEAAVATAQTNVTKAQAALTLAQQTLSRDQTLLSQGFIAPATVDTDRSNVVAAQSALAAAQASLAQARAQVAAQAAQAQVQQAELNLQHTIIRSPVDGTVVARDVSVGQTVAASLQTPTLFSIA